jgi:endonuclease-8
VPEGDTIHRLAARFQPLLEGRALRRIEVHPTGTARQPGRVTSRLPAPGTLVESVEARGKHLYMSFSDGTVLHTHLGMHGQWDWYPAGAAWRRPRPRARAVLEVEEGEAVCFDAPTVLLERGTVAGDLGPDLCRADADLNECVRRMATVVDSADPVGDVLLDQRVACGVGNVYKSEVCFTCGVDPATPIAALDDDRRRQLVEVAARMLRANLGPGPRTTVSGRPGSLAVYGRARQACRRCGGAIQVARTGAHARPTYWCPTCQPRLDAPT